MRWASLATLCVALSVGVAGADVTSPWSPAATLATCAPAAAPKVLFPFSAPAARSGHGAILWLGGAPACAGNAVSGTTLLGSSLHTDDALVAPRVRWPQAGVVAPFAAATTSHGQLVAAFGQPGGPILAEGVAGGVLRRVTSLGTPGALIAATNGYIGDADVVSASASGGGEVIRLWQQRHFETAFSAPVTLATVSGPVTALTVAMDFRADSIVLWVRNRELYARWITNTGGLHPVRAVGPADDGTQVAAVLSDNNHAFVMWTDEPASGVAGPATIYLDHSQPEVTFGAPQQLTSFPDPRGQRLGLGSIALLRMTPSEGVLAAWTSISNGRYAVS